MNPTWTWARIIDEMGSDTYARARSQRAACFVLSLPLDAGDQQIEAAMSEIQRLRNTATRGQMSDLDALLEDVAAAQARIDAGTANMGEYDFLSDAAPLLAAEVKRLRDETSTLGAEAREAHATLARTLATLRGIAAFPSVEHTPDPELPPELRDVVAGVCALLDEQRLTLAAEQGRQEGAPGPGWEYGGQMWHRGRRRCATCRSGWEWWLRNDYGTVIAEGRATSARAAMQAADEVSRG
jgi:hypothetical protein